MGEVAVIDAIRDAQKHYAVDADRITIGGASMGGTGGFRLAALHPDRFAAAHSLTGGGNYAVPVGDGRFDATLLLDNLCNTGVVHLGRARGGPVQARTTPSPTACASGPRSTPASIPTWN